ncbi:hypothetical protein C8F04DRAFT_1176370 [Mycena alexandri]|uniref:Uncharacterized protein n=1 Tax=Mycena alexandri TaxID=1745969 RepID=A0AAD6TAS4_9AGAR|nr:hypothetical protein C8F04DRAFT_1176370 [Mycena alexandri]
MVTGNGDPVALPILWSVTVTVGSKNSAGAWNERTPATKHGVALKHRQRFNCKHLPAARPFVKPDTDSGTPHPQAALAFPPASVHVSPHPPPSPSPLIAPLLALGGERTLNICLFLILFVELAGDLNRLWHLSQDKDLWQEKGIYLGKMVSEFTPTRPGKNNLVASLSNGHGSQLRGCLKIANGLVTVLGPLPPYNLAQY